MTDTQANREVAGGGCPQKSGDGYQPEFLDKVCGEDHCIDVPSAIVATPVSNNSVHTHDEAHDITSIYGIVRPGTCGVSQVKGDDGQDQESTTCTIDVVNFKEARVTLGNTDTVESTTMNTRPIHTFRSVYRKRTITEKEYLHLSSWVSGISFVVITAWFIMAYIVCGFLMEQKTRPPFTPTPYNYSIAVPILLFTTIGLTALVTIVLAGLCLWKSEYSLVKTRGKRFIVGLALSALIATTGNFWGILGNFVQLHVTTAIWGVRNAMLLVGGVSVIAILASRQGFLYHLFLGRPFDCRHLNTIWYTTYIACIIPVCIVAIIFPALGLLRISPHYMLLFFVPYLPPLCVLVVYAYKSRRIGSGFGHWGSNFRLALFLTVVSVSLRVIVAYWMPRTTFGGPAVWTKLLIQYVHAYLICIAVTESLLSIAILAVLDVRPLNCLNPRITFRTTFPAGTPTPVILDSTYAPRLPSDTIIATEQRPTATLEPRRGELYAKGELKGLCNGVALPNGNSIETVPVPESQDAIYV